MNKSLSRGFLSLQSFTDKAIFSFKMNLTCLVFSNLFLKLGLISVVHKAIICAETQASRASALLTP